MPSPPPPPPPAQARDFLWTALGAVLSVPLSRAVPPAHRFAPLIVLGTAGGLADFYATEARNKAALAAGAPAPAQQQQQQQQQQQRPPQ